MKVLTVILGLGAAIGVGYIVNKRLSEKRAEKAHSTDFDEDEVSKVHVSEEETVKETAGKKIYKASMFAVGALRTGTSKIAEGVKDIVNEDMVKKGEETISQVKEKTVEVKKELSDLKNMVTSINDDTEQEDVVEAQGETIEDDFVDDYPDMTKKEESAEVNKFEEETESTDDEFETLDDDSLMF